MLVQTGNTLHRASETSSDTRGRRSYTSTRKALAEEREEVEVLFWVIRVSQAEAFVDGEEACVGHGNCIEPVHCYGIPSCPNLCL